MQIDLKQIKQNGATDGQSLNWDNISGQWTPKTPSTGGGGSGSPWVEIARIIPPNSANIDFTGIPAGYSELFFSVEGVNSSGAAILTYTPFMDGTTTPALNVSMHQSQSSSLRSGFVHVPRANGPVVHMRGAVQLSPSSGSIVVSGAPSFECMAIGSNRLTGMRFFYNSGNAFATGTGVIILYGRT